MACSQYSLRLLTLLREIIVSVAVTENIEWLYHHCCRHEWLILINDFCHAIAELNASEFHMREHVTGNMMFVEGGILMESFCSA